jgi:hypothetical protein
MSGIMMHGRLYTMVRREALDSLDSVVFLQHLLQHVSDKLLMIWDGSPLHIALCISNQDGLTVARASGH